jgi:hypothetical protein
MSNPSGAGEDGGTASLPNGILDPDGAPWCPGTLDDSGYAVGIDVPAVPSLADVADLCATAFMNDAAESTFPCQGSTFVGLSTGPDTSGWYLFDSTTGAVQAVGGPVGSNTGCEAAVAGFQFPYQCFNNGVWGMARSLCTEGGAEDSGAFDAVGMLEIEQ